MKEALKLARDWIAERPADRPVSAGKMISIIDRALAQPDAFEQGKQEGMKQERALWELSRLGQEIEAQPERPWVGLTEGDMYELGDFANAHGYVPTPAKRMFAKIEAKLKEKNT